MNKRLAITAFRGIDGAGRAVSGQPSFAADPAPVYRVEVVVFVYPGGASDQRPSTSPVDFSAYPDTRANARAAAYQPRNRSAQALTEQERRRRARDQAISAVNALNALEQGIRPSIRAVHWADRSTATPGSACQPLARTWPMPGEGCRTACVINQWPGGPGISRSPRAESRPGCG